MCFSSQMSLFTFSIGTIFSILLIKYGNPKYKRENTISGIFLLFISMIQLMDFLFWIDLKNKLGINKIMTILGPILNVGQPVILYIIKYYSYRMQISQMEEKGIGELDLVYFMSILMICTLLL